MRNTRKSGQILRSKKRPRPTLRSGRGNRTNSNTSHQIPERVIEADSARADSIKKGPPGARAGGGCCSGSDRAPNFQGSAGRERTEEHTSELLSRGHLVCRLLLEKKKKSIPSCALYYTHYTKLSKKQFPL